MKLYKIFRVKTIKLHCIRNTGLQQCFTTKVTRMKLRNCLEVFFVSTYTWSWKKKTRWNLGTWLTCCIRNCPPFSRWQHIIVNCVTHFCEIPSFAWRCGNSHTNNRFSYTQGSITAFPILFSAKVLFVISWRQF